MKTRLIAAFALLMACAGVFAGPLQVNTEGVRSTYTYIINDFEPLSGATDVLVLSGATGKVIRVTHIEITADANQKGVIDFYIFKRSAQNTGGTFTYPTPVKHDSANPAASAVLKLYTANPSALGAGQMIRGAHYSLTDALTTGNFAPPWLEDFGVRNEQPILLRNANEALAISLNGQTLPAGFDFYITIEWTEE